MLSGYNDHPKNNLARYLARIKAKVRAYIIEYFLFRAIRDYFSLIPYSVYLHHLDKEFILRQYTFKQEKSIIYM